MKANISIVSIILKIGKYKENRSHSTEPLGTSFSMCISIDRLLSNTSQSSVFLVKPIKRLINIEWLSVSKLLRKIIIVPSLLARKSLLILSRAISEFYWERTTYVLWWEWNMLCQLRCCIICCEVTRSISWKIWVLWKLTIIKLFLSKPIFF